MQRLLILIMLCSLMLTLSISAQTDACATRLPPNFYIGAEGELDGETPNRIRNAPTTSGEFVDNLLPAQIFTVIDGPVCADGYLWWQIQRLSDDASVGWTVQGTNDDNWLIPVNDSQPRYDLASRYWHDLDLDRW